MALELKFDTCIINACTQIRFTENTGFYNSTNLSGYGTPNPTLTSMTSAVLEIIPPSNITYTLNLFTTTLFPSNIPYTNYDIPLSSIGSPTSIIDGKWKFVYTVSDGTDIYSKTIYKYFYCNSECCVKQMLADLNLSCDCCKDSDEYKNYELVWVQLESLKKAAACGDSANFETIKKIVDKLCLNNGCKTCK